MASDPDALKTRLLEIAVAEAEDRKAERDYLYARDQYTAPSPPKLTPIEARAETPAVPAPALPAPSPPMPEYLDTEQAAALLGVTAKSLEGMRARGTGPAYSRIGRLVRYARADLAALRRPK